MAAKVESAEAEQTNTIDPATLRKELERIEQSIEAAESHKMAYVESCKPYKEAISRAYEMAGKICDVPIKVLKTKVRERDLQRKIESLTEDFEPETLDTYQMISDALGDFGNTPLGGAAKDRAAKAENKPAAAASEDQLKRPRGRRRKAPSPDAAPAAAATEAGEGADVESAAKAGEASPDVAGLDPRAVAETDHPTYERGHKAGLAGTGCTIPGELSGLYQDRWHAGWLAGDAARHAAGEQNAERLRSGISPLH